jgi:hypothetical protein
MKTFIAIEIRDFDQEKTGNIDTMVGYALYKAGVKAIVHQQQRLPIYIHLKEGADD